MSHYFASASHDRTARIWSMDRIQPLRIMAGHLSDVDVSISFGGLHSRSTTMMFSKMKKLILPSLVPIV